MPPTVIPKYVSEAFVRPPSVVERPKYWLKLKYSSCNIYSSDPPEVYNAWTGVRELKLIVVQYPVRGEVVLSLPPTIRKVESGEISAAQRVLIFVFPTLTDPK